MKRWLWLLALLITGCAASPVVYNRAQELYSQRVLEATARAQSKIDSFYQDRPTARQEAMAIINQWENAGRKIVAIYDDALNKASNNRVRQIIEDQLSAELIKVFSDINSIYWGKLKDKARGEAVVMLDEWENEAYKTKDPERFNTLVEQLAKRMTSPKLLELPRGSDNQDSIPQ